MPVVIGLDIGGVNTKAAWRDGDRHQAHLLFYDLVHDHAEVAAVLRDLVTSCIGEPPEVVAVTMTAELSDEFATKREGVAFVLDAVAAAVDAPVLALTTAGELVDFDEARARPLDIAAANWVASALAVGRRRPDALMIDVGSTTADVIPIADRQVAAAGRTDLDRLLAGELVYTGALRTNLAAIGSHVPVRGQPCPVASELFALSGDVHLVLGHLAPDAYTCPTPDGRPATVQHARARIARLVCADTEQLAPEEIDAIAAHLHAEQVRAIGMAAQRAGARTSDDAPVVPLGVGAFLAREVADRLGRPVAEIGWSAAERDAAPAAALAELAAARVAAGC